MLILPANWVPVCSSFLSVRGQDKKEEVIWIGRWGRVRARSISHEMELPSEYDD